MKSILINADFSFILAICMRAPTNPITKPPHDGTTRPPIRTTTRSPITKTSTRSPVSSTASPPVSTGPVSTGPVSTGPVSTGPVSTGPVSTTKSPLCRRVATKPRPNTCWAAPVPFTPTIQAPDMETAARSGDYFLAKEGLSCTKPYLIFL